MKKPIIEFKDFSFKYKSQLDYTLKNINLTIYEGEKVLFLGPSGCGKSTLANCINGLIPHSYSGEVKGTCIIDGINAQESSIFALSSIIGTVLQDSDAQFVGLTVGEDIAYALENDAVPRDAMLKMVEKTASIVGMGDFLMHVPYNLSGGQKQRVALAGAMHGDVKILLFDEPLAALDPCMGNNAIELIDRIHKEQNKTILIIEHRLEDVIYRDVDRIILMSEGEIIADVTLNELLCSGKLAENGIREPLYITALKSAGCEITPQTNPGNIETMELSSYAELVKNDYEQAVDASISNLGEEVIKVENVAFSYKDKNVLEDISFSIKQGEKIAIVGKNGAGKSTMAKLLCGVVRPTKGEIYYKGENYLSFTVKELGEKIGYVMQNPNQMLVKEMIREEVSLGLALRNVSQEEIDQRVDDALKKCNLYSMRNWPIGAVSYGQKKRVTVASILAMNPEIIILDEPTAGQDYKVYTEMMEFLDELNREYNITILFITHDMHLALEYTDRAIVFSDGKCISDDTVFKVLSNPDIIEQANLKKTSLYTLATRLGINAEDYIKYFISKERRARANG